MDLRTKYGPWAFIAGASEGLGAAFAHAYAARGVNVVIAARRAQLLEGQAREIREAHGVEVRVLVLDLGVSDVWERVDAVTSDIEIGMFVYNAAYEPNRPFLSLDLEEHLAGIDVNCRTPTILSYRLGKKMAERGRGSIVLVSSMAALQGMRNFVSYSASKAYELILAEGMWEELRDRGVDVVGYVVGSTLTPKYLQLRPEAADPAVRKKEKWLETPEQVAVRLLEVIDQGPRQFTSVFYEGMAKMTAGLSRAEAVKLMSKESSVLSQET
jgi:uncharacterized protein